jgi:hypothetical protein
MHTRNIQICTLQETKSVESEYENEQGKIYTLKHEAAEYGQGFFISKEWQQLISSVE